MCGSHYSIRGYYPYAHYGNIHLQLNTFISPSQHKFVDGTGNDPAYTLPAVRSAFHTPAHVCPPYLHRPSRQVNKVIPYKPLRTLSE